MDEDYKKALEDKIKALWHQVEESKEQRKDHEKRIVSLEVAKSEDRKDLDRIFDSIEEIKNNLNKIATAIENYQQQGSRTFSNLKYEIIKYIIIAALAATVAKIF